MDFLDRPRTRKLLNYERITHSQQLSKDCCIFICCNDKDELHLNLPTDVPNFEDNSLLPLETIFGNLRTGVIKIVNVGKKDIIIEDSGKYLFNYKNRSEKINRIKISYGEDKFFLKSETFWYIY